MKRTQSLAMAMALAFSAASALGAAQAADASEAVMDDAVHSPSATASVATPAATPAGSEGGPSGGAAGTQAADAAAPGPSATAARAPWRGGDSLQDRLDQLEDQVDDQRSEIRGLKASLEDVRSVADARSEEGNVDQGAGAQDRAGGGMLFDLEDGSLSAQETPLVWRRLKLLVNVDLEYTSQYDHDPVSKKGEILNGPDYVLPALPNGSSGMYFKHVDLHFDYKFNESMFLKLDYNLSALEIDDAGVGWKNLPFPPFTSGWGDYSYSVFIGQRRQYFGIEQQTDSRYLLFPNRALMDGGPNPFGNAVQPTKDAFALYDGPSAASGVADTAASNNLVAELVYEKTMGLHLFHAHDLGFLAYTIGVDIVNDESEGSVDGGGTDSLESGFPLQYAGDQDVSEIGRLGLEPRFLNDALPLGMKFKFGASAFHDPENTVYYASKAADENWADAQGLDGTLETARGVLYLQSEYVKRDQYGSSFSGSGASLAVNNVYGGLQGRAESWYVAGALQPWRIFDPEAPRLELLARYENYHYDDMSAWLQSALTAYTGSYNATTVALKYTYQGNCHTSVNYTTYGLNNNFGAMGPTALFQVEQQVNF